MVAVKANCCESVIVNIACTPTSMRSVSSHAASDVGLGTGWTCGSRMWVCDSVP
jgi:hypothetical protein